MGRVGGPAALKIVEAAIADSDPQLHEAGLRALCNWPDASIAARLIELVQKDEHPEHRTTALRALIRIASLPDGRTDAEKLELLRTAMAVCTRDPERNLVLQRGSPIRIPETLRFLMPYLDQPAYAQQACQSVVELAHHRDLREPNKAEFDRALGQGDSNQRGRHGDRPCESLQERTDLGPTDRAGSSQTGQSHQYQLSRSHIGRCS